MRIVVAGWRGGRGRAALGGVRHLATQQLSGVALLPPRMGWEQRRASWPTASKVYRTRWDFRRKADFEDKNSRQKNSDFFRLFLLKLLQLFFTRLLQPFRTPSTQRAALAHFHRNPKPNQHDERR